LLITLYYYLEAYYTDVNAFFVDNKLDAQFFSHIYIPILYMFRAPLCAGLDGTSKPAH